MIALLLALVAAAAAARLELAVDTRTLAVGETVTARLQLVDGVVRGVPDLPAGEGVAVRYQSQGQSTVMVNFRTTRIVQYDYALTAVTPGEWTVGPVELEVDGQRLRSPEVRVEVRPRSAEEARDSEVSGTLSDTEPFVGEVVVYRFLYRHRDRVLDARWSAPDFDGFLQEKTAEATQREYAAKRDGADVSVQEIFVPLVAVGEGARVVAPAVLTAQVPDEKRPARARGWDPFADSPFGRMTNTRTLTMSTESLAVRVRPLPAAGRPADFSGLVGRFEVEATPSASSVAMGDSITIEVALTGTGTLAGFRLPPLAAGSGFRSYDDDPEITARVDEGEYRSRAVFRRAVVPEVEGKLRFSPVRLSVFDPEAEAYVTLESDPIEIEVRPGEKAGAVSSYADGQADARQEVVALGDDVLPVRGDARVGDRTLGAALPVAVGLPAIPGAGLVALLARAALRRRRRDPWADLRVRLASLPAAPEARLAALESLFREAAAMRLSRPAPGLDRALVAGLGPGPAQLYADIEACRYGGVSVADVESRVREFVAGGLA